MEGVQVMEYTSKSCIIATKAMSATYKKIISNISQQQFIDFQSESESLKKYLQTDDTLEDVRFWCEPKIDGGNTYKLFLQCGDKLLLYQPDIYHCAIGIDFEKQCSYYARTMMVNATLNMLNNYCFMMAVAAKVLENLKDGVSLSQVFEKAISFAKETDVEKAKHLKNEFGFLLCPGGKDESSIINQSATAIVRENSIVAVSIQLTDLEENGKLYTLYNADTVFVRQVGPAKLLTLNDNHYEKFIMKGIKRSELESGKRIKLINDLKS